MNIFTGTVEAEWSDMSKYVVHFTKEYKQKSPYDNVLSILVGLKIKARNAFGIGRELAPDKKSQRCTCFSEIPLAWEREWRHVGQFKFTQDEFAFLIIPDSLHAKATTFFEQVRPTFRGASIDDPTPICR